MTDPGYTYPEVGATQQEALPSGYRHLTHRVRLPAGALPAAAAAILTWRMHRGVPVRLTTTADRAAPGVLVTSYLGLGAVAVAAPCAVVWTLERPDRAGFGYGTLPGHPAIGEESFVVSQESDGEVWFTVRAFSRPARWYTRAAGPIVPVFQRAFARRCGRVLRRLAAAA